MVSKKVLGNDFDYNQAHYKYQYVGVYQERKFMKVKAKIAIIALFLINVSLYFTQLFANTK